MYDGLGRFSWDHTATLEALQINMNRKKGTRAVSPRELNPFVRRRHVDSLDISGKEAWGALKGIMENGGVK